ncbi:unnamed protein product [Prorocentrum cordatum]|uniref:MYND-type domain-containing protein n=1 Tax=Prorocentrum cordatum TaxID=2364126 RepID=A0ABN9ST91_9DINO|nr:unnamed protein product [Polarella glacialis]
MAERRKVTCPMCGVAMVASSQEECMAHMEVCGAFKERHGDPKASPEAPAVAPPLSLEEACERYASAVLPLVPLQRTGRGPRSGERLGADAAVQSVVQMTIVPQLRCVSDTSGSVKDDNGDAADGFALADLATLSLAGELAPLGRDATAVRAEIVTALGQVKRASDAAAAEQAEAAQPPGHERICGLVGASLGRLAAGCQFCDHCGRSRGRLLACTRCQRVKYCGQACQRARWPAHRADCAGPAAAA